MPAWISMSRSMPLAELWLKSTDARHVSENFSEFFQPRDADVAQLLIFREFCIQPSRGMPARQEWSRFRLAENALPGPTISA
jgi:hypothetical protein